MYPPGARYGAGYQLELTVSTDDSPNHGPNHVVADPSSEARQRLDEFVETLSPHAALIESHGATYLYQLPPMGAGLSLGSVFTRVHEASAALEISDYTITQPSLEQVFLKFARDQVTDE